MSFSKSISADLRNRRRIALESHVSRRTRGEPSKADLQSLLAEAAQNTAKLPVSDDVEEFSRVVGPLLKGKRH